MLYKGKKSDEPWYIFTNLDSCEEAITAYKARSGIEAMFKDCKSGGDNLEGSKASVEPLTRLVLLIAIAITCSGLQGLKIKQLGQQNISIVYKKSGVCQDDIAICGIDLGASLDAPYWSNHLFERV